MRILYDVSQFGLAVQGSFHKSGIFRVVEKTALLLHNLKEPNDQLAFCATTHSLDAKKFIVSHQQFKETPFYVHNSAFTRTKMNSLYSSLKTSTGFEHLRVKTNLKAYYIFNGLTPQRSIPRSILEETDIFHTPYYGIPNEIREFRKIQKFVTFYDLSPILHPELVNEGQIDFVKQVVKSITVEDWILAISHSAKNDLCNYSDQVDPQKIHVTHLAADPDRFYDCQNNSLISSARKKYAIPEQPFILSVCTLEPRKNLVHLIRCFAQLVNQNNLRDLCLVLTGSKGWNFDDIFAEIKGSQSIKDQVIVTGYVDDDDLAPLYSSAIAFVYPSIYEGFGLPPLEAMQCGVPVITSNTSSLPEVVGDAGIMLDPKDQDGLCQAMLDLYNKPELRSQMSKKSLLQASKFSWERCVEKTMSIYRNALTAK